MSQDNKKNPNSPITVPLTVPTQAQQTFSKNYALITHNTGRLFLFAGDQKIEHLNKDFYGPDIAEQAAYPKHLFDIAQSSRIGAFATHLGLIARYGAQYQSIPYIIKLNGKTDLVPTAIADPTSKCLVTINDVIELKQQSSLNIVGVGITVYLGSTYESEMLAAASQAIIQAHKHGLITIVWMYPRGKSIADERNADLIAGATGIAVCLGADFVKINAPRANTSQESAELLAQATAAAGNTGVICSGGSRTNETLFLQDLHHHIHTGNARGAAIGRNIHQKTLKDAQAFCNAVAAIIFDNADVQTAIDKLKS